MPGCRWARRLAWRMKLRVLVCRALRLWISRSSCRSFLRMSWSHLRRWEGGQGGALLGRLWEPCLLFGGGTEEVSSCGIHGGGGGGGGEGGLRTIYVGDVRISGFLYAQDSAA